MTQRHPRIKSSQHLEFIRRLPSLIPGREPVEAAHLRYPDLRYGKPHTGMGEKPDDCYAIPLSADQHRAQHAAGDERRWWERHGVDPVMIAILLWSRSGDDEAGHHIIRTARSWPK